MINRAMLETVINDQTSPFDSHDVIKKVAHQNQREYIEELYAARDRGRPFQYVHSRLGQEIKKICTALGYQRSSGRSPDTFGQESVSERYSR